MLMNDVEKHGDVQSIVIKNLRNIGVKYRSKKISKKTQDNLALNNNVFNKPLHTLTLHTMKLENNASLQIPQLVHELCSYISCSLETEGLFRKAGSTARQKEIKLLLNAGCELSSEHHVIDVANVLKLFFRELPEPLLPYAYHDLFLQCLLAKKGETVKAIMLSCLLLPPLHLSTLSYFMEFLQRVVTYSKYNKMDVKNIAIVMTPTIMPIQDKVISYSCQRLTHHVQIIQILLENAEKIGIVPDCITDTLLVTYSNSGDTEDDHTQNINSMKKKKKRRSGSLTRMFNGLKKMVGAKSADESHNSRSSISATPDLLLTPCLTRSAKKRKVIQTSGFSSKRRKELLDTFPHGSALGSTPFKPGMTPVCHHPKPEDIEVTPTVHTKPVVLPDVSHNSLPDNDFVRIPKSEYEEIKSRVSAIEDRISIELSNVQAASSSSNVQSVYEKTMEEVGVNSPTTDQLAKRLSKELKIRRSSEHKIIRSPSARKIGSIRRRSQELIRLTRNQSCHIPRVTLKRGRPNTVMTGLPHPSPIKNIDVGRSSSFHSYQTPLEKWASGEVFFNSQEPKREVRRVIAANPENRDSLQRLRSQNAGMVLAKAKLFDDLSDSSDLTKSLEKKKIARKGGTFPRQTPGLRRQRAIDGNTDKENEVMGKRDENVKNRTKVRSPRRQMTHHTPLRVMRQ